jgi:uncharacterized cupredoxin-like copper-binding protein
MRHHSPLTWIGGIALTIGGASLALIAWVSLTPETPLPAAAPPERTIAVSMTDGLRFDPERMTVVSGESVRFLIANPTTVDHEFVIGDLAEQRMHGEEMASGMMHADAHAISVPAGQTRELIHTFGAAGNIQIGCHVPGHYEAGMHADIAVTP